MTNFITFGKFLYYLSWLFTSDSPIMCYYLNENIGMFIHWYCSLPGAVTLPICFTITSFFLYHSLFREEGVNQEFCVTSFYEREFF